MLINRDLRRLGGLLIVLALLGAGEPQRGTIELYTVAIGGLPLDGAASTLVDDHGKVIARSSDGKLKDVPYGSYQINVVKDGFYTESVPVVVDKPVVWLPVSMTLGMEHPDTIPFRGIVLKRPEGIPVWVKLVSLYSDYSATTRVNDQGKFIIHVPYRKSGRAILLTFHGARLQDKREVMIRGGDVAARIE